ncbi:hypothetical protein AX15_006617 [Amanita polypyramis BW_CC]|nr:hypothetical protein AX15_006617 [Amanita polypyramis BW_CC]
MAHNKGESGSFFALTRHDEYFLTGGDLFVMVDHVQFRIHKFFFERESPFFRSQFTAPAAPGAHKPGSSESTAIILDGLKPAEFARFLWVFYNPKYSIYNASVDDWSVILRLAHRWTFHEVKELAIRELERLDSPDIDRIVLYHDCEVDRNLLIPRYAALCHREEPLNLEEGKRLGLETILMIARAREFARGPMLPSGARSPTAASLGQSEMVGLIRELFGIPSPIVDEPAATNMVTLPSMTPPQPPIQFTTSNNGNQSPKIHNRNSSVTTTNGKPSGPVISTSSNGSATSSAPENPPKPPSKTDSLATQEQGATGPASGSSLNNRLEKTVSKMLGSSTDPLKDGSKDPGKDTVNDTNTVKDVANDAPKSSPATTEAGANRGRPAAINTAVTAQNNDIVDLLKGEDSNGKQSPTPRNSKKWVAKK